MEVYFNELCLDDIHTFGYSDILRLTSLYKKLKTFDIGTCRISSQDYISLITYARTMRGSTPDLVNFLYAFLQQPYENDDVDERQDEYFAHSWKYQDTPCYGLALGVIMESMTLSMGDRIKWDHAILSVFRDDELVEARNLYSEDTFSAHTQWMNDCRDVELKSCLTIPAEKKIHLRDDHGKDVLLLFCNKLINSPYVCEVVNSLPYNSERRKFIHAVRDDGIIEIVLPWTDKGLGIVVKTTGQSRRETERIAELLNEKYGYL